MYAQFKLNFEMSNSNIKVISSILHCVLFNLLLLLYSIFVIVTITAGLVLTSCRDPTGRSTDVNQLFAMLSIALAIVLPYVNRLQISCGRFM